MFNKTQLAERGRHYFDDSKVKKMYATTDGNFFYEDSKNYADSHAKSLKTQVISITRSDLVEKKAEKKPKEKKVKTPVEPTVVSTAVSADNGSVSSFDDLKAEAKKLKIRGWAIMKEETLQKKIDAANGTT